ncbi:MAG: 30S ribosomal protein S1 [Nitrospirae bacterium]|nr:30S ribosomal protein S1 [Nitrospirota bacterium]
MSNEEKELATKYYGPDEEDMMDGDEDEGQDEMARLYDESFKSVEEGTVVIGRVIQVRQDGIVVDVGYKSEGIIPIDEIQEDVLKTIKVGDDIEVYLEEREDSDGNLVLSKEKADKIKIWEQIEEACNNEMTVMGKVIARIKGGMTVDVNGVKGFLPGSQVDLRPVRNLDSLIGQTFELRVLKVNQRRGNIVLSRRALLEEVRDKKKAETLSSLAEGSVIEGIVKNITEYGAFIDLGGIDGLLHITDMSWGRVSHPSEMFMVGDKVKVMVLRYDKENEKVSLGHKQLFSDPWAAADERYPVGARVRGKVVSLTDYGAFVELEQGIEGLVHVSEMSWTQKVRHPSKVVAMGDIIDAVVLSIDKNNKRISLGMKQIEPNPWDVIAEKYPIGSRIEGRVRNLTDFGAFVGLDEGIDGLIHISDISWTKHLKHPSEVLKKGQKVDAVVLSVDKDKERLSLGLKQLGDDPWDREIPGKYRVGDNVTCKVIKITDFGVFVELEGGVEGLIHISEIDKDQQARVEDLLKLDDEVAAKIIKVDTGDRKIGLSIKAFKKEGEKASQDAYKGTQEKFDSSLGARMKDAEKDSE